MCFAWAHVNLYYQHDNTNALQDPLTKMITFWMILFEISIPKTLAVLFYTALNSTIRQATLIGEGKVHSKSLIWCLCRSVFCEWIHWFDDANEFDVFFYLYRSYDSFSFSCKWHGNKLFHITWWIFLQPLVKCRRFHFLFSPFHFFNFISGIYVQTHTLKRSLVMHVLLSRNSLMKTSVNVIRLKISSYL